MNRNPEAIGRILTVLRIFPAFGLVCGCTSIYWREGPCDVRSGKPEWRFDPFGAAKRAEKQKDAESASCEQKRLIAARKAREQQAHLGEIYPRLQKLPTPSEALEVMEGRIDRHFYSEDGGLSEIQDCQQGKCAPEENRRKITPNLYEVYNGGLHDSFSLLYKDETGGGFKNCGAGQYSYWNIKIMAYPTPFGDIQKAPALVRLGCTANWSDPFRAPGTDESVSVEILPQSASSQDRGTGASAPLPPPKRASAVPVIRAHIQSLFPESAKPGSHDKRPSRMYKNIRPEAE